MTPVVSSVLELEMRFTEFLRFILSDRTLLVADQNRRHDAALRLMGWFFILLFGIIALVHVRERRLWVEILWYCDLASIVLGAGILIRSPRLVAAVMLTAVGAQFGWNLEYLLSLFGHGWGRTQWMLEEDSLDVIVYSILLHSTLTPAAIYAVWRMGFPARSIWYAIAGGSILLTATFFLTPVSHNINCVFYDCDLVYARQKQAILADPIFCTPAFLLKQMGFWFAVLWATHIVTLLVLTYAKKRRDAAMPVDVGHAVRE